MTARMVAWLLALASLATLGLAPLPAHAIEALDGTYTGRASCKGVATGMPVKGKRDLVIEVSHEEGTIALRLTQDGTAHPEPITGSVAEESARADRARIGAVDCTLDANVSTGVALAAEALAKPGAGKATLKGTYFWMNGPVSMTVCTFSAKRTSTDVVVVDACL